MTKFVSTYLKNVCLLFIYFLFTTFWFVFPSICVVAVSDLFLTFYLGAYFTLYVHQRGESPWSRSRRSCFGCLFRFQPMRFNVFVTKNTWVFSVSRFVSTACTRFLIITLLFGFLIPKFSFNLFLIIAFFYEIYHWIFSRGVRHCLGLRCGHSMQSCNVLCFLQR